MELQKLINKRNKYGKGVNLQCIFNKEEINFLQQEIIKLNKSGLSFIEISKKLNIGRKVIRNWMKSVKYEIVNQQNRLRIKENLFESISTEEDAYWLGFIYADGCISDDGMFDMSLKYTDYPHLIKFAEYCEFDKTKVVRKLKTNIPNCYRTTIHFALKDLKFNLFEKGVLPRKSLTLTFPKFLSENLQRHFIRGYFDGDGSIVIYKNKTINDRKTVSLLGTKEFCSSLLKILKMDKPLLKDKRHLSNTYSIVFKKQEGLLFLDFIYKNSNVYLDRKYKLFLHQNSSSI